MTVLSFFHYTKSDKKLFKIAKLIHLEFCDKIKSLKYVSHRKMFFQIIDRSEKNVRDVFISGILNMRKYLRSGFVFTRYYVSYPVHDFAIV